MYAGTPLDLPGTFNVRDLGGMPTASGRHIAAGRLFRAELLAYSGASPIHAQWDPQHRANYDRLRIRTIIDLRGAGEVRRTASAWPEALGIDAALNLAIDDGGDGAHVDYVRLISTRELERFTPEHMAEHYLSTLDRRADVFASGVRAIATGGPTLVHCAAGKDRTGLLIAIVLAVMEVPDDVIVADYALTGELRPDRAADYSALFAEAEIDLEDYRVLFESPANAMVASLAHLRNRYGSAEQYLVSAGGMEPKTIDQLRDALLD